ncbi:hypothetical protein JG688_00018698 [Phytophthora aleatoria]|uniref:EF-hand domain-containing protein n=1 Tax=Phytophthora aleatoria TaxID=2496075 RepID=A0A8J5IBI3_9STRA|nr:hypothetical protein JG688_00018698 [Phytophthora aleatoria]
MAARRSRHLRRWAAKTRVSLFVHQIWTACWFHSKRSCNVAGMKQELALFEESDRNVQLEYTVVFATPLGKDVLKRELAVWRVGARTTTTQNESPTTSESDVDAVILRLRQCFRIFDLDGSGTLDLDEFQLMLSYLRGKKQKRPGRGSVIEKRSASESPKLTSAQVRNLFSELDQDGDGSITCTEFESWWTDEHERSTFSRATGCSSGLWGGSSNWSGNLSRNSWYDAQERKPNVRFYIEKFIESVLQMCFYPSSGATPAVVALD